MTDGVYENEILEVNVELSARFGFSGIKRAEAIQLAIKQFLDELKEGKGIEKISVTVDKMVED